MTWMSILVLVSGLAFIAVGLPLVHRKVPMNPYYGFRVEASFASEDQWYAINEYSARLLMKWSVVPILAGLVGLFLPEEAFLIYSSVATGLLLVAVLIPLWLTLRWIRRTYGRASR